MIKIYTISRSKLKYTGIKTKKFMLNLIIFNNIRKKNTPFRRIETLLTYIKKKINETDYYITM